MRQDKLELPPPPGGDRPGDRWMVGPRSDGSRSDGSRSDGSSQDQRVLTWSGRRRRVAAFVLLAVALATFVLIAIVPSAMIIKPGELSTPHAQILAGSVANEKCAACHTQASLSPLSWFQSAGESHNDVSQSDLCLNCHHRTISENLAMAAHNLPLSVRSQLTESIRLTSRNSGDQIGGGMHPVIPDAAVDQNDVSCGTCHKEHHGDAGDLRALTNDQCQTCHSARFGAFAESHPDWNDWPYGRGGEIAFNHVTHSQKHFPGQKSGAEKFDCSICHPDASSSHRAGGSRAGEVLRVASFENSCQSCHDNSMNVQAGKGLDFVSLPSLPPAAVEEVVGWPEQATGFADGVISPLAELLLRSDPSVSAILRRIPQGDIGRMPADDPAAEQRLRRLAIEIRKLIDDIDQRGQSAIEERLLDIGISTRPFRSVLRSLPPQLVESANAAWFDVPDRGTSQPLALARPRGRFRLVAADDEDLLGGTLLLGRGTSDERVGDDLLKEPDDGSLLLEDPLLEDPLLEDPLLEDPLLEDPLLEDPLLEDPLLGDPLLGDPLLEDPLTDESRQVGAGDSAFKRVPVAALVRLGGWYRDDNRLAIRYHGHGHADPVMVGMIETFAQLNDGDPLKQRFFADSFVSACISCHAGATSMPSRWRGLARVGRRTEFTKFSHAPHLNVSALGDCVYCHRLNTAIVSIHPVVKVSANHESARANGGQFTPDFAPLDRAQCAACHNAKAAGDDCTTCHRYHIGP